MPRLIYSKESVLADWKTGKYTMKDLSSKHRISTATVHRLVSGVEKTIGVLVNKQLEINQELAQHSEKEVNLFRYEVEDRTKYIKFFNNAAIKNTEQAMLADCNGQNDYRTRAETISKGREVVLGKTPDVTINNTNAQTDTKISYEIVR